MTVQAGGQGAGPGGHTRKRVTMKDKFIKKPTIGVTAPGEVRDCVVTVGDGGAKMWEGEGMACRGDRFAPYRLRDGSEGGPVARPAQGEHLIAAAHSALRFSLNCLTSLSVPPTGRCSPPASGPAPNPEEGAAGRLRVHRGGGAVTTAATSANHRPTAAALHRRCEEWRRGTAAQGICVGDEGEKGVS